MSPSAENPHAGQGSVLLDIGGDVGALVVTMPAEMEGVEVEIRPVGANPSAARYAGMRPAELIMLTMSLCGLLAGLAGGWSGIATKLASDDLSRGHLGLAAQLLPYRLTAV